MGLVRTPDTEVLSMRFTKASVRIVDEMIKEGIFHNRAEAVRFFVEKGVIEFFFNSRMFEKSIKEFCEEKNRGVRNENYTSKTVRRANKRN